MEIVDAYTHCGLRKYKPIENIREVMRQASITRAVLVQHLGEFDNSYIGNMVESDPEHFAGVCLVDHTSVEAGDVLQSLAASGRFKGVRFTTDTLTIAPGLWKAADELNLVIVIYAPEGIANYIGLLKAFLEDNPECHLVITHMGNPDMRDVPHFSTYKKIFEVAKYSGVYYQISGMKMFCPYPHKEFYPMVAEAVERFGTSRLVWGSNYPVVGDEQDYTKDLRLLLDGKLPVPKKAIADIVGGNALRLWFPDTIREGVRFFE